MSGVPDTHNINASALPGGGGENAPITVMRGGGPENVSLLSGGEEQNINIIRGGGDIDMIGGLAEIKEEKGDAKVLRTPFSKVSYNSSTTDKKFYQVEMYDPKMSDEALKDLASFIPKFNPSASKPIELFTARQTPKWQQYSMTGEKTSDVTNKATHKLIEVLPKTTETIIVVPPIKNDLLSYFKMLEFLYMNDIVTDGEVLKPNTVLIFMAPFFGDNEDPKLLYSVLHLQERNPNSVFILRKKGNMDSNNTELLNPSYIVLPIRAHRYHGFIFSHEGGLKQARNGLQPSSLVETTTSFSYNPSPTLDNGFNEYLNIISQGEFIPPSSKIVSKQCESLFTLFYSDHIIPDNKLSSPSQYIMIMRVIKKEEPPLICSDFDGDVYGIPSDEGSFRNSEDSPQFQKAESIETYIQGEKRYFRKPENKVIENWKNGIYSKGEVDFLNYLKLSPNIVESIFGSGWSAKIADFLKNIIESKCFDDTTLSIVGGCEETRSFLTKVYSYFLMNPAEEPPYEFEMKDEEIDFLDWPSELHEIPNPTTIHLRYVDLVPDHDKLHVDLIVIHKKLDRRNFMRLIIKTDPSITEYGPVISTILRELEKKYPEFLIIYS